MIIISIVKIWLVLHIDHKWILNFQWNLLQCTVCSGVLGVLYGIAQWKSVDLESTVRTEDERRSEDFLRNVKSPELHRKSGYSSELLEHDLNAECNDIAVHIACWDIAVSEHGYSSERGYTTWFPR